jgi:hypothetical protein
MILLIIGSILLIGLGGMWGLASYEGAHAEALQAQALITANQTTQVSVVGQTVLSIVLAVVVLTILVGAVAILITYKRWQNQPTQTGGWQSGPNARWQRSGQIPDQGHQSLEMSPQTLLFQQQMLQQQILATWMLRQMSQPVEKDSMPEMQTLEMQTLENQSEPTWWE